MAQSIPRPRWAVSLLLLFVGRSLQASDPFLEAVLNGQCSWSKYGHPFPSALRTCPAIVTDVSDDYAPWSYRPYCIQPALADIDAPEYCVFTHNTFRGRALSLITTPELAASMVESLDDSTLPESLRDHPSSPLTTKSKKQKAVDVKNVKGRGKGTIARRRIQKWETAFVSYPVMVVRADFLKDLDEEEKKELKELAVSQLPERQRKAVLNLAHTTGGELIEDILRTNIFSVDIGSVPHMGLFLEGSVRLYPICRCLASC